MKPIRHRPAGEGEPIAGNAGVRPAPTPSTSSPRRLEIVGERDGGAGCSGGKKTPGGLEPEVPGAHRDRPSGCYDSGCPLAVQVVRATCDSCGSEQTWTFEAPGGVLVKWTEPAPTFCPACPAPSSVQKSLKFSKGFVLGAGNPRTAKLAICLEAAGQDEIEFRLVDPQPGETRYAFNDSEEIAAEIERRQAHYSFVPLSILRRGVPVVGRSGGELGYWVFKGLNIRRENIFIDNVLRCQPPEHGDSNYPIGATRKRAEQCCRQYDRWDLFAADVAIVSLHPAGVMRDVTPLYLQVENFKKALKLIAAGKQVVILAGGKATKAWLGYGENVTFWQGHFEEGLPVPRTVFSPCSVVTDHPPRRAKKAKAPKAPKIAPAPKKRRRRPVLDPDDVLELRS